MDVTTYFVTISFVLSGLIFRVVVPEMNITFERVSKDYKVFEGSTVRLLCSQERQLPLTISRDGTVIVKKSVLFGSPSKYSFEQPESGTIFILTIQKLERSDKGRYFCEEQIPLLKQFYLDVLYHPNSGPNCTSSYDPLKSYFDDESQEKFHFNCTVEEGNPPVDFMLFKEGISKGRISGDEFTVFQTIGQSLQNAMFSSHLDVSFNNSRLTCIVTQNIPQTFLGYNFNRTCFYGPMKLLPSFDISVSPSNVTVRRGDVITLTCSSNVSSVEKRWSNIPKDLPYEIKEDEKGLHLILNITSVDIQRAIIVCECLYGRRQRSADVTIHIQRNNNVRHKTSSTVPAVISGVLSVFIVALGILIVCYKYFNKRKNRKDKHDSVTSPTVEENVKLKYNPES